MSGTIGQDVSRVEGPAKAGGSARYSGEIGAAGPRLRRNCRRGNSERPGQPRSIPRRRSAQKASPGS